MGLRIVLLPSVLLGERAWSGVRDVLAGRGHRVSVAGTGVSGTPKAVIAAYLDAVPSGEPVVVVPHSNAGLYVPQLVAARLVAACVFVDASLPPAVGAAISATGPRREHLAGMAGPDGLLPAWTAWWDEEDLDELLPDVQDRQRIEAGQIRLPLQYFDTPIPVPEGWEEVPCGYVSFGGGQSREIAAATARGWSVTTLAGHHLHLLTAPEEVADAVTVLVERLLGA